MCFAQVGLQLVHHQLKLLDVCTEIYPTFLNHSFRYIIFHCFSLTSCRARALAHFNCLPAAFISLTLATHLRLHSFHNYMTQALLIIAGAFVTFQLA